MCNGTFAWKRMSWKKIPERKLVVLKKNVDYLQVIFHIVSSHPIKNVE